MQIFYSWVKNIAFFIILVTMVMHVLPNIQYKKYVSFFTGIVMILLVISPILKILNQEVALNLSFQQFSYEQELSDLTKEIQYAEKEQKQQLLDSYTKEVEAQVEAVVESEGLFATSIAVKLYDEDTNESYGTVQSISIQAAKSREENNNIEIEIGEVDLMEEQKETASLEEINLKNTLEDFYNISGDNINISIQE